MTDYKRAEDELRRKQAELDKHALEQATELRESRERLSLVQRAARIGIFDWLIATNQVTCSEQLEALYGLCPGGLGGRYESWRRALHPEDSDRVEREIREAIAGKREYDTEFRVVWPDGSTHWLAAKGSVIRGETGEPVRVVGVHMDITEHKRLEEQLRLGQRMEAVGRLAAGVAHDFNNILTVISGHCNLLLEKVRSDDPQRASLEEILRAAERAASLTQQLLAFSRQQVMTPRVLDLDAVVENMQNTLRRVIGERIDLQIVTTPGLGRVKADPAQLEQVIVNLAVNARDAMPHGGSITIKTANQTLDDTDAGGRFSVVPGPYVMLAVTDTGTGMEAEIQAHIFEPFFTTKERGMGTGLGLATVYGIVKQSGGYIWAFSEVGRGTTMKICLPRVEEPAEQVMRGVPRIESPRSLETILLVEDEDAVRALVRGLLESRGYKVLEARNGCEALGVSREYGGEIALLLTDLVMPRMGGRELAEQLTPSRSGMKILFMSGYTDEAVLNPEPLNPGSPYIKKPFTPGDLAAKVRQLLDGGQP